ncbi:MAG: DUF4405 domain-containing protein [Armatimonadia bacterium]
MRRVTSIVLTVSFILVSFTGLQMAFGPRHAPPPGQGERVAADVDGGGAETRAPEGPPRHPSIFPKLLHEWLGYLLVLSGVMHIVLNWRPLLCHFGLRPRKPTVPDDCPPA